uniref:AMP-dependent synthetase/ligase domain-containing protein n=2 Tax=Stomoxys calcitrans TaxID=35570 RepID=A0A1I8PKC3_STOCA
MKFFTLVGAFRGKQRFISSMVKIPARTEFISKLRECYRFEEHKQIVVPIFKKALLFGHHTAVKEANGQYSYLQLYVNSKRLSRQISNLCASGSSSTVGLLFSNDVLAILSLWACWMSGQIAVPLNPKYLVDNLQSIASDSQMKMLMSSKEHGVLGRQLAEANQIPLLTLNHEFAHKPNHHFNLKREIFMTDNLVFFEGLLQNIFYNNANAMQLYFPQSREAQQQTYQKNFLSHNDVNHQMKDLARVWNMSCEDKILNILPSCEIYSYVATTLFPLAVGSTLQIQDPFNAHNAWNLILGINVPLKERINVLIAEPKVYEDLILEYEKMFSMNTKMRNYIKDYCCQNIRLMLCCIEKLPKDVYCKWLDITGHSVMESDFVNDFKDKVETATVEDQPLKIKDDEGKLIIKNRNVRILDSENNILFEMSGLTKKKFYTSTETVIGSLWISPYGKEDYVSTGDVVAFQNDILIFLGRCCQGK